MSEQRLENGPKPMSGPEAAAGNPSSAHEAARFIATVSLSLGALMLSLFGIIERMVTFQKLAVVNEFALLALLPGIATLAWLGLPAAGPPIGFGPLSSLCSDIPLRPDCVFD